MHIELIDLLRCPRPHEESWLVAALVRVEKRFVIEGRLGCPVCGADYTIRDGVANFNPPGSEDGAHSGVTPESVPLPATEEEVIRVAAMLGLVRPGTLVVLAGSESGIAPKLAELASARVIAVNPPPALRDDYERVGLVRSGRAVPLASRSAEGVVLDQSASEDLASDAIRLVKPGGRLVAPPSLSLPTGFRELARDDRQVVAEFAGDLISLSR